MSVKYKSKIEKETTVNFKKLTLNPAFTKIFSKILLILHRAKTNMKERNMNKAVADSTIKERENDDNNKTPKK